MSSKSSVLIDETPEALDRASLELYQSFMAGYVRRINEATFRVAIGGVRIGSAKYSRLAQINLKTRIMTFSRYAIENVPERGRRYLVLHELAHVKEASHNRRFWQLVANFEPDYKQIGRSLELAFKQNVKEETQQKKGKKHRTLFAGFIGERAESKNHEIPNTSIKQAEEVALILPKAYEKSESTSAQDSGGVIDIGMRHQRQLIEPVTFLHQLSLFD